MFKGHPKGLYVLFFSNMGERFGYYTMLAIFTLFLQDHFGWDETRSYELYGIFLAGIYFAPLIGGFIADRWLGYGKTVSLGIIIMAIGYALLAMPVGLDPTPVYIALAVISIGVGFFKGNLVVILGNLYEKDGLKKMHDAAFNIFYMGINIGAMFAPHLARAIKNYIMEGKGFTYEAAIPKIANNIKAGIDVTESQMSTIQHAAQTSGFTDVKLFATNYLDTLSEGYHWGFGFAVISLIISIAIFLAFRSTYKEADYQEKDKVQDENFVELTPKQVKDRVFALILVFIIVIFFWMAFHQNGSALTGFAKNYTNLHVSKYTYLLFSIPTLLAIFASILGLFAVINKKASVLIKSSGAAFFIAGLVYIYYTLTSLPDTVRIDPELFQSFNPMFVVWLTPVMVGFFAYLAKKRKEPSAPTKIGIGMMITAFAYVIMLVSSQGLPSVGALGGNTVDASLAISPYWLISTYFTLTIAELFLSPMGLSFVAKVAPPKLRGLMQGGWLAATAVGNYAAGYVGRFYQNWELWQFFILLAGLAALSGLIMFSILKIVNRASNS